MKKVLVIGSCCLVSACQLPVKAFVDSYCAKSVDARILARKIAAEKTKPHMIKIECANDR